MLKLAVTCCLRHLWLGCSSPSLKLAAVVSRQQTALVVRLLCTVPLLQEPEILRFFYGRLAPIDNWQDRLAAQFKKDFGEQL